MAFFSAAPLLLLLLTTLFLQKSTEAMKTLAASGASLVPLTQRGGGGVQSDAPPRNSVSFARGIGGSARSNNLFAQSFNGGNGVQHVVAEDSNGSKMIQEVQKNREMLNMAIKEHVVKEDVDMVANLMAHMGDSNEAQHMVEALGLLTVLGKEKKMLEVIKPIEKIIAERENKDGHQVVLNQAELDKIASHRENLNEIRESNPNEDYDTIGSTTLTKMIQGAGKFIASVKGTAEVELNGQAEAGVKKFEAVEALKERADYIHNLLFRYDQEKKRNKKGDKKILLKLKETPESIARLYEPHGVKQ